MRLNLIATNTTDRLKRYESKVDSFLSTMSVLALALVVLSQFLTSEWPVPFLSITWSNFQIGLRAIIWLLFVSSFVTYASLYKRPSPDVGHPIVERIMSVLSYARHHMAELIVCLCWVPQSNLGTLDNYVALLSLTKIVPLDILQLSGTLAHAWRAVGFIAKRFRTHPLFVTGTATTVLVSSVSALLVHFEPATFPTFWDAAWYSVTAITKGGVSDAAPHTIAGRAISMVLFIGGWALIGVFFGLVNTTVRSELLAPDENSLDGVQKELEAQRALLEKVLKEKASDL